MPDVADLRNTPSKVLYEKIKEEGGICHIFDPFIDDFEDVFDVNDIKKELKAENYDVIIFTERYDSFLKLDPITFIKSVKKNILIVDTFDIFDDNKIQLFLKNHQV